MSVKSLFDAIKSIEQPPCTRGEICEKYQLCADEKLACHDFWRYVTRNTKGKKGKEPSREIYNKAMQSVE